MSAFTLRNKIEESKAMYLERCGKLDWQWTDEGLPYSDELKKKYLTQRHEDCPLHLEVMK